MTFTEAIKELKEECCADCSCHPGSACDCPSEVCKYKEAILLAIDCLNAFEQMQNRIENAILYGEDTEE